MANYKTISTEALIAKFQQALDEKWGYIWGTAGEKWTQEKQNKTTNEMAKKYGAKWIGKKVADCSGLFSWAFKQLGSYTPHGSNSMWKNYCTSKGDLKKGKRTDGKTLKPGTAAFTDKDGDKSHVGLYIGNGWVIESEGTIKGVIKSKITNSKWKCWGELKYVNYGSDASEEVKPDVSTPVYPTLRQGSKGDTVKSLQEMLSKLGSTLQVDGIFGPGTRSAVQAFQRKNGLEADGVVGSKTWAALNNAIKTPQEPEAKPEEEKPIITYPTLRRGSKGELVTQLQDLLSKDGSTLQIDGIFGIGTQSAVKAFQKKHNLKVDGIVGPKTWAELIKIK